jgi:ABC-2 type transport system permease protein
MTAANGFERVEGNSWTLGFGNLFARENRKWWASRRWWVQAVIWLVILVGLVGLVLFVVPTLTAPDGSAVSQEDPIMSALQGFFGLGGMALAIGITILMQDELVAEKQAGTAEWVLSKPVSRAAFFLAKLFAHTTGMLLVMLALPSLGAYALLTVYSGAPYPLAPFLAGVALLSLHTFFYLTLTLMLGVLVERRELILAVAMASLLGGSLIRNFLPSLSLITPWFLPDVGGLVAMGAELPAQFLLPIVATPLWSLVFIIVALRAFRRHEF